MTSAPRAGHRYEIGSVAASTLLLAGTGVALASQYAFVLLAFRGLGPRGYGDIAALSVFVTVLGLPLQGLQAAVAVRVAHSRASSPALHATLRELLRRGLIAVPVVFVLLAAPSPLIGRALHIQSEWSTAATAAILAGAVLAPILFGSLQGLQLFAALALVTALSGALRPLFALVPLAAGGGASAVMVSTALTLPVTYLVAWLALRRGATGAAHRSAEDEAWVAPPLGGFLITVGLLALTVATNLDVLAVKHLFPGHVAGVYALASQVGKLGLLVAATLATVLVPKTVEAVRRGGSSLRLEEGFLAAAVAASAALVVFLELLPSGVARSAFGAGLADGQRIALRVALAMTPYALLYVVALYGFARGSVFSAYVLCGVAAAVVIALLLSHSTTTDVVRAIGACGALGLLVHETLAPTALWRRLA